jgi:large subunit ribosomal protein L25
VAEITLNANVRAYKGRSGSNTARRLGMVPGVYYQGNVKNVPFEVKALDLRPLIYTTETHIVDLRLSSGEAFKCVLRDVQFDPITDKVMHIDLMGLDMSHTMVFEVPVVLEGQAPGVRAGGVLNHIIHKLEVTCLPSDLPEHITVDVSQLNIGDQVTIGDLHLDRVEVTLEADQPVVILAHGRHEAEAVPGEPGAAEPEVITRGKSAEED